MIMKSLLAMGILAGSFSFAQDASSIVEETQIHTNQEAEDEVTIFVENEKVPLSNVLAVKETGCKKKKKI